MVELAGRDVFGDQTADQVIAGFALFAVDQLLDVGVHGAEGVRLLLVGRSRVQSDRRVVLEEREVFGRHPQQQRDHQRRHRQAEVAHDVGRWACGDHLAEKVVDQFLNLRPHRFATPEGEVAGQHASQPVMLGIVGPREHHRDVVVSGRRRLDGVRDGLRGQARIDQRRPDVLVAAHHPGRLAVVHRPSQARAPPASSRTQPGDASGQCAARGTGMTGRSVSEQKSEVVDITSVSH